MSEQANSKYLATPKLKKEEIRLIEYIRNLKWGECTVKVKNSVPVMVHSSVKDTKLTD